MLEFLLHDTIIPLILISTLLRRIYDNNTTTNNFSSQGVMLDCGGPGDQPQYHGVRVVR